MNIAFYNTTSAPNVVNKDLGNAVISFTDARPTRDCNILAPVLIMTYYQAIASANYVYISDFGRYYFIKSITLLSGGRCAVSCAVDVLYTYREQIRSCKAMILRSESIGAPTMFTDNKFPIVSGKKEAVHITIDSENNVFTSTPTLSYLLGVLNRKEGTNNGN